MKDLLKSYRETRAIITDAKLKADPEDEETTKTLGSMLSDVQYAIDWLNRGHAPASRRGIHRRSRKQREILIEPLRMQSYANPAACGSPTTITDSERQRIDEAMYMLTERERECYIMKFGRCFTENEIAGLLGLSRTTVQTHIQRAEAKISESLSNNLFLA